MKKFLVLAVAAAGALVVRSKLKQQEAESLLWAEATKDSGQPNAASAPPGSAGASAGGSSD